MTAIFSAWMADIILESWGAFVYRNRSPLLSVILSFTALTDIAAYALIGIFPPTWIYFWAGWGQFYVKELMLIWLGCAICGMFVEGRNKSQAIISTALMSLIAIVLVMVFFFQAETLKDRLLAAECVADTILLVIVFLAWIGRRAQLSNECKWITAGFLIMVSSDVFFTVGWFSAETMRHWYPAGQIIAYGVWICGPLRKIKLPECRADLGKKFGEIQKVQVM